MMMENRRCREMRFEDLQPAVDLYIKYYNTYEDGAWTQETTYKRLHQVWSREDALCFVLEQDNQLIGIVIGYLEQFDDIQAYDLVEIVLDHDFQHQGIGTELMLELETHVIEHGGSMIQLEAVNDEMHEKFYGKLKYGTCTNHTLKSKWLA